MKRIIMTAAACLPLLAQLAFAGPNEYVFTPAVTYGEREIDFKIGTAKKPDEDRGSAASILSMADEVSLAPTARIRGAGLRRTRAMEPLGAC